MTAHEQISMHCRINSKKCSIPLSMAASIFSTLQRCEFLFTAGCGIEGFLQYSILQSMSDKNCTCGF